MEHKSKMREIAEGKQHTNQKEKDDDSKGTNPQKFKNIGDILDKIEASKSSIRPLVTELERLL